MSTRRKFIYQCSVLVALASSELYAANPISRRRLLTTAPTTVVVAPSGFKTEWVVSGDATARTITLPLVNTRAEGALVYNFTVDWGDGATSTVTAYNDANRAHTYAANGTYVVEIKGTMEGWSFNNGGDKLKITKVLNWGESVAFNGFKYLASGFFGCTNLISLSDGSIPASGTGVLSQGFSATFASCVNLTSIPSALFIFHAAVSTDAFNSTFASCANLTSIPADVFKYNISVSTGGFAYAFINCTSLVSIPTDLFKYNTLVSATGFSDIFNGCTSLAVIPVFLFRYNTSVSSNGFNQAFRLCNKLRLNSEIFYALGEESTRFLNRVSNFASCFYRTTFTGVQGTAPALWDCDFGTQTPTKTNCFAGAGNSLTSLDNYASIPTAWKT